MTFDKFDRKILIALERDGRLTNLDLAQEIGLSPTPCQKRVSRLTGIGVISEYNAVIDKKNVGLTLVAFAFVTISPHRKEQVEEFEYFVSSKDEIYSCHIVSGASDYMLEIVASDMDQYTIFIKEQLMELNCVASVESNFSMSCIKKKSSISKLIMHEKI